MATESSGAVATESGGAVATESGEAATTGDETVATADNETAANGGVMYADEGPYTIDVRHVEKMVGRLEKRRMATESAGDETGGPGTRPATRRRR